MSKIFVKCTVFSLVLALLLGLMGGLAVFAGEEDDGILLSEDFDTVPSQEGDNYFGYNGWGCVMQNGTGEPNNSDYTIVTYPSDGTNKVARLNRPNSDDQANNNGYAVKALSRQPREGYISVRFSIMTANTDTSYFQIRLMDNVNASKQNLQFQIDFPNGRIGDAKAGGLYFSFAGKPAPALTWYNFEIFLNLYDKTVTYFENGRKLNETPANLHPDFGDTAKIHEVWIGTPRFTVSPSCFYFDNLVIEDTTDYEGLIDDAINSLGSKFSRVLSSNVTLPTKYYGTNITWQSADESIITNEGVITRPAGNEVVSTTITATVSNEYASGSATYNVYVLPLGGPGEELLFAEDFDTFPSENGQHILGYNGWNYKTQGTSTNDYVSSEFTIQTDPKNEENNVASLLRTAVEGNDNDVATGRNNLAVNTLSRTVNDGILSVKFRLMRKNNDAGYFRIQLQDSNNGPASMYFQVNFGASAIGDAKSSGGTYFRFIPSGGTPTNTWYNFEILVDRDKNEVYYYESGKQLNTAPYALPADFKNANVDEIWFGAYRMLVNPAQMYFDDIVVASLSDGLVASRAGTALENLVSSTVSKNMTLPTGVYGASVAWESSNESVIANDGTVTRQVGNDVTVTLTATITKGSEVVTKSFPVTVLGAPAFEITAVSKTEEKIESVSIEKRVLPSQGARVIVTVYDADKIADIKILQMENVIGSQTIPVDMDIAPGQTLKVFMWNMENINPLSAYYSN